MKIALIDGFNLAFRAYYGMPELAREDGFPTGAIHGWVRQMWWVEDNIKADKVFVFFDLGGASRQLAIREDYKANSREALHVRPFSLFSLMSRSSVEQETSVFAVVSSIICA